METLILRSQNKHQPCERTRKPSPHALPVTNHAEDTEAFQNALNLMGLEKEKVNMPRSMDSIKPPPIDPPPFLEEVERYLEEKGSVFIGAQARGAHPK